MAKVLEALDDNHTRNLVKLPNRKKPITFCWVYKVKYKSDGSLEKCKARLVAKGFNQKEGVDYHETFFLVLKYNSTQCLVSLVV